MKAFLTLGFHCGPLLVMMAAWLAAIMPARAQNAAGNGAANEVVIYTAFDQIYSEPILTEFEARGGVRVRAVYDSEAAKTVGLVSRIQAERARPRCDVFWNNEIIRTLQLKRQGLLEPYASPQAEALPAAFKDPEHQWTGFAARLRVVAYNTTQVTSDSVPRRLSELTDARWRGRLGMAYPLFGTTATHAAVLEGVWGAPRARGFFERLKANQVQILEGNMQACRAVAEGELPLALTDSDDASLLRGQGKPVDFVPLDHDGQGALLIPNTLALVRGAPHPEAARRLIDYLLSAEVEARLAACPSAQLPLRPGVPMPSEVERLARVPRLDPRFDQAAAALPGSATFLKGLFTR